MKYHLVLGSLALMLMDRILLPVRFSSPLIFYLLESVLFISITSGPSDSGSTDSGSSSTGTGGTIGDPPTWPGIPHNGNPKEWYADAQEYAKNDPAEPHAVLGFYFPGLKDVYSTEMFIANAPVNVTQKEALTDLWYEEGQPSKGTVLADFKTNLKRLFGDVFIRGQMS
jgi:hypothetical protein